MEERATGMKRHYDAAFNALLARIGGARWRVTRHRFATELSYLNER